MSIKKLALSCGAVCTLFSMVTPAQAREGFYVGLEGGAVLLQDTSFARQTDDGFKGDFDTGFSIGGVIGYQVFPYLRIETEVSFKKSELDSLTIEEGSNTMDPGESMTQDNGDVKSLSGMVNLWFDVPVRSRFTPYLGGGLGVAIITAEAESVGSNLLTESFLEDDQAAFAWQLGAGVRYAITDPVSVSLDYRYFSTTNPTFQDPKGIRLKGEYDTHNIGVTFAFWF